VQPLYSQFANAKLIRGWPENASELILDDSLVIVDDLMTEVGGSKQLSDLFTRGSHHRKLSIVWLTQNVFPQGRFTRNLSLNAQYIIICKNPRDGQQIRTLASQIFPGKGQFLIGVYEYITKEPFQPILIDCRQETVESCRIVSHFTTASPVYYGA
jgi:hypothetical protein